MGTDLSDVHHAMNLIGARLRRVTGSRDLDHLAKPMAGEVVQALTARIEVRLRAEINHGCCECCDGQCPTAIAAKTTPEPALKPHL